LQRTSILPALPVNLGAMEKKETNDFARRALIAAAENAVP
jgi:hypothetical protein